MVDRIELEGHTSVVIHRQDALDSEAATMLAKPRMMEPLADFSNGDQVASDTRNLPVTSRRQAKTSQKPSRTVPGGTISEGLGQGEIHLKVALDPAEPDRARTPKPLRSADISGDHISGGNQATSVAKRRRSKADPKPNVAALDGATNSVGRPVDETQHKIAGTADEHAHRLADFPREPGDSSASIQGGHDHVETQLSKAALADGGHPVVVAQRENAPVCSPLVSEIVALARRRSQWKKACQKLELQEHAIARSFCGGDKDAAQAARKLVVDGGGDATLMVALAPLIAARACIEAEVKPVEKVLKKLAVQLPAYAWVKDIRGFGDLRFALIVGACGDIGSYRSPSAVWKRMGLAVIEGGRQRRVTGAEALAHGYSPERRAIAWNLGSEIIRAQPKESEHAERLFYEKEKARQRERVATDGHADNRAKRHMTKRVLLGLWVAWRRSAE